MRIDSMEQARRDWERRRREFDRICDQFGRNQERERVRRREEREGSRPFEIVIAPAGQQMPRRPVPTKPVDAEAERVARLMSKPLADLSNDELQQRYEAEEAAAMIAMTRAQRTLAEIAGRAK